MKYLLSGVFVAVLLVFDQVSKFFFQEKNIELFSFFSLHYAENTGAAFSLFQGQNLALILLSVLALGFVLFSFHKYPIALSFVLAGLLGNLLDRILFGFVRDFISVSVWPIF